MDTLDPLNEIDGKIILTFLENDLEVRGDFYPAREGGIPLGEEYIRALLEKFNIVYGVKRDEILAACGRCANENKIVKDIPVASGDPAVDGVTEYMQLNPFLGQKSEQDKEKSAVDHRARSPFIIVKKGQALAKLKRPKPGTDGTNVHGEVIARAVQRPEGVIGGENTFMRERLLLASINGQLVNTKNVVSVRDSLVIKGPVGYATGNIIFPGDVEIEGPVSDGFKIFSSGSVTIKQTFDVTEANTKNDLNVAGGIIGRGRALVKVGGNLKTKFIENCRVACRKTITVDTEIINSNIFTMETLEMGEKGKIVGGEVYAVKGIRTGAIGKKTGKAARIHCGVDFTLAQEKEKANGLLRLLAAKAGRLKELIDAETDDEKKMKMETGLALLREEQHKAQVRVSELLGKLNAFESAVVEVRGEIAPGTLIEICHAALFVTEPLNKVRIRLARENGRLVTDKI